MNTRTLLLRTTQTTGVDVVLAPTEEVEVTPLEAVVLRSIKQTLEAMDNVQLVKSAAE